MRNEKCNPTATFFSLFIVHWSKYVENVKWMRKSEKKIHVWNWWTRKSILWLSPEHCRAPCERLGPYSVTMFFHVPCLILRMNKMWLLYNPWVCSLVYCAKIKWYSFSVTKRIAIHVISMYICPKFAAVYKCSNEWMPWRRHER